MRFEAIRNFIRTVLFEGTGNRVSWHSAYHGTSFPTRSTRGHTRKVKSNVSDTSTRALAKWPPEGVPTFITTDYDAAEWYANRSSLDGGEDVVIELDVSCKNAAGPDDFEKVLQDLRLSREEIDHSWEYDQEHTEFTYDLIYREDVRRELESRGFDGLVVDDPFSNQEIPAIIVWHRSQVKVIGIHPISQERDTRKNYTDDRGITKEYDPDIGDWVVTRLPSGWAD